MLRLKILRGSGLLLCGFVLGAAFILTTGFERNTDNNEPVIADPDDEKVVLEAGIFGDIEISIVRKGPEEESLVIYKDQYPFITILKHPSGEVPVFYIVDGEDRVLAAAKFEKGKMAEFGIYGNEISNNERMFVLIIEASDKPKVWHRAMYLPDAKSDGTGEIKFKGESYIDVDFDGQFDAMDIYSENSELISQSLFVNGKWLEICKLNSKGDWLKKGAYDVDDLYAVTTKNGREIYYDFEFGKGWKKR